MKTRFLIIIGIICVLVFIPSFSYGTWREQPLEELWGQSQTIFVGNVISVQVVDVEKTIQYSEETDGVEKNIVENYTLHLDEYAIEINSFLKNPQNFDIITVREPTVSAGIYQSTIGGFELDDRVLFYVPEIDGTNQYSPESQIIRTDNQLFYFQDEFKKFASEELPSSQNYEFKTLQGASCIHDSAVCYGTFSNGTTIPVQCDYPHSCGVIPFDRHNLLPLSPLKQFKLGIPIGEMQCKEGLQLAIKKSNNNPICVKETSIEKLQLIRDYISDIVRIGLPHSLPDREVENEN